MQEHRYPVKLPAVWRIMYIGVGILCLSMAASSAGADLKTQLLAWGFFGVGGMLVLRLMFRNSGWLVVRDDGLLVDTPWSTGLIRWEHLQNPKSLRLTGLGYLGLSTSEPEAYLKSRDQLAGLTSAADRVYTQGFFRGMIALLNVLPPAKGVVDVALAVFGWSPLPKSTTEAEMLEWQGRNYGAQIAIPRMWIPDFDTLLNELQAHASRASDSLELADSHVVMRPRLHAPEDEPRPTSPDLKTCPMCAESVQRAARICRYCRHAFDDQSPSSLSLGSIASAQRR